MPTYIKIDTRSIAALTRRLGSQQLAQRSQIAMTREVDKRIGRYMAYRAGVMSGKAKRMISPSQILVDTNYAHFQYTGIVWIDPNTGSTWAPKYGRKVPTSRKLTYDTSKNAKAGPYWDKALMANESAAIFKSVANEIILAAKGG